MEPLRTRPGIDKWGLRERPPLSCRGDVTAIYLDYNATTPVDPQVLEAMLPFLRGEFGNPSSSYALGRRAHAAVERARARGRRADRCGARRDRVHRRRHRSQQHGDPRRRRHAAERARAVVTSNIEHPATDACCDLLERQGHTVRRVAAGSERHRRARAAGSCHRRPHRARHHHSRAKRDRHAAAGAPRSRTPPRRTERWCTPMPRNRSARSPST